jgi:hypothetical protein
MSEEDKNKLIDFLKRESNGHYTEFRLIIRADRTCYAHVLNKDSKTIDFALDSSTPENPGPPPSGGK